MPRQQHMQKQQHEKCSSSIQRQHARAAAACKHSSTHSPAKAPAKAAACKGSCSVQRHQQQQYTSVQSSNACSCHNTCKGSSVQRQQHHAKAAAAACKGSNSSSMQRQQPMQWPQHMPRQKHPMYLGLQCPKLGLPLLWLWLWLWLFLRHANCSLPQFVSAGSNVYQLVPVCINLPQ